MTLENIAKTGNSKELREALRDRLAAEIDACTSARDIAALSRQLMDVTRELELDSEPDPDSPAERIRKAEEARRANK